MQIDRDEDSEPSWPLVRSAEARMKPDAPEARRDETPLPLPVESLLPRHDLSTFPEGQLLLHSCTDVKLELFLPASSYIPLVANLQDSFLLPCSIPTPSACCNRPRLPLLFLYHSLTPHRTAQQNGRTWSKEEALPKRSVSTCLRSTMLKSCRFLCGCAPASRRRDCQTRAPLHRRH